MEDLAFKGAVEVAAALQASETTSVELTELMLHRIERMNSQIGAYSCVLASSALSEATASDRRREQGKSLGPLDGIPIAIKDLIDTVPAVCSAGLDHLRDHFPSRDAPVVKRLRNAGAVILGVTETDPGAFSTETLKVQNPVYPERIAGGSSGGSAAAVAAGLVYVAIGTDTGGSIRIPAACCGVYGFKPTFGRVTTDQVMPLAPSLDHVGPIARNVSDLGIVQSILDQSFAQTLSPPGKSPLKLGFAQSDAFCFDADVRRTLASVRSILEESGLVTRSVSLPSGSEVLDFHMINLPWEAARYHHERFPTCWKNYPEIARDTIERGLQVNLSCHKGAERQRDRVREQITGLFDEVDAIVTPTMPILPPPRDTVEYCYRDRRLSKLEATIWNTAIFNQTGHPVVALNMDNPKSKLPVGIQVIGKHNTDASLLKLALRIDRSMSA